MVYILILLRKKLIKNIFSKNSLEKLIDNEKKHILTRDELIQFLDIFLCVT